MTEQEKAELHSLLANTGISLFRLKNKFFKYAPISSHVTTTELFDDAMKTLQHIEELINRD